MKTVIIGANSDIAQMLKPSLGEVVEYHHNETAPLTDFDLLLICSGYMMPMEPFEQSYWPSWERCLDANVLYPLRQVRLFYPHRREGASIVFFAGPDPNKPHPGMSAYHLAKIMLISAAEQLNEELDCKVFILGPGYINTKIHKDELQGKIETRPDDLREMLLTCIAYPKEIIGGRNIHIRDPWRNLHDLGPDNYRLRRA